jgi:hypothetical protein
MVLIIPRKEYSTAREGKIAIASPSRTRILSFLKHFGLQFYSAQSNFQLIKYENISLALTEWENCFGDVAYMHVSFLDFFYYTVRLAT